jgi:hypothetical protein
MSELYCINYLTLSAMRDGIYKGLKLGRRWSRFLRRCEREADRGARTDAAAVVALENDLRRGVSPATVRQLLSVATSVQSPLPGFSPDDLIRRSDIQGNNTYTPLEDAVWRHFKRAMSEGTRGLEAVQDSIRDALREWGSRCFRHVQEHYLAEAGNAAQDVLRTAEAAIKAANCDEIAARLVSGEKPESAKRPALDPDENLLRK